MRIRNHPPRADLIAEYVELAKAAKRRGLFFELPPQLTKKEAKIVWARALAELAPEPPHDRTREHLQKRSEAIEAFMRAKPARPPRTPREPAHTPRESKWSLSDELCALDESAAYAYRIEKPSHGNNRRHGQIRRAKTAGA